jgi:hypothetical protein
MQKPGAWFVRFFALQLNQLDSIELSSLSESVSSWPSVKLVEECN